MDLDKNLLISPGHETTKKLKLKDWDPDYTGGKSKRDMECELSKLLSRMSELQYKLFADSSKSILIILQGVDASGKDGTIRRVMGALNPQSCYVKPFKFPTTEEISHDYLWRVHIAVPQRGQIAIFNRSHYEDVINVLVNDKDSEKDIGSRFRQINDFERYLSENSITILKFFLYISKNEQKKKLQERLENPDKHWKLSESDFVTPKYWDRYMKAYEEVLRLCSTEWAPWYIIPANVKAFRNWAVAQIIVKTLENMKLKYPDPKIDVSKFVID
jgi:PPK2 family polyphosphate:nucleotide phosphotransferase